MRENLKRKLPQLLLFTVITFLMIYTSGDKISVFNFMLLPLYVLMILNGQTGILGLDINPVFNIVLDVLVLGSLIYALYVLFKAGVKGGTLSKTTSMSSILILLGFSVFIGFKATLSVTTTITLTLFIVTAVTTLLAIAIKKE